MARWQWPSFARKQTDADILDLLSAGGGTTSAGIAVTAESALRVPAVAAAVRTIAEAVASLRIGVVSIDAAGKETPDPKHPVHSLLTVDANDWTSGFEMIRGLMVDALTRDDGGRAWVNWVGGQPVEIVRYGPGMIGVELAPDGSGRPVTYRVNGRPIPPQEVIHLRGPFEKCPVTLAREAIGVAVVMEKHAGRLFGSGAKPGGVISTPKNVGDEGVKRMLAGWKAAHDGADKAGKTAILWDGATWSQMTLNSVDSQFQQLRIFQLQEIARAFNIPSVLIGELSRATWSNSAEMQRLFLMLCLEPWLKALEGALRRALFTKEERPNFAIRIERDDFSKVDLSVLATAMNSLIASRVINPNEARDWLGMPDRDGGDEFANPNTGASQPGGALPPPAPQPDNEDPNAPQPDS